MSTASRPAPAQEREVPIASLWCGVLTCPICQGRMRLLAVIKEPANVVCVLTGSSARKLRRGGANLLAGRASTRRLHPLTMAEQGDAFDLERTLRPLRTLSMFRKACF